MEGVGVNYNTYWIRFGRGRNTLERAVENSKLLFDAADRAGVGRIFYLSVANYSSESGLPYCREKGEVEDVLKATGIPLCHHPAHPGLRRGRPAVE